MRFAECRQTIHAIIKLHLKLAFTSMKLRRMKSSVEGKI